MLNAVDICDDNPCPLDQELFFANYSNKEKFISELARKLESESVNVVMCSRDAGTTIIKVALQIKDASALVFTDDTDNLCLLIHHVDTSQKQNNIYIKNMTKKKESNERVCYKLHDAIDNLDPLIIKFILFTHAFAGCDTTSAIHYFGKQAIFPKLEAYNKLQQIALQFFLDNISPETIGNASVCFFEELYSPGSSLQQIRKIKYHKMVSSDRASIDPALLPPPSRAAYYHDLRVCHQMNVWRQLSDDDIDLLSWGWKISNGKYSPIMTDIETGPPDILKIIRCGCKGSCNSRYSCRKAGVKCAFSCKECHGVTCSNVIEDLDLIHREDDDLERNIFGILD